MGGERAASNHGAGRRERGRDQGFTLLEALVALSVALPALIVLYRQGLVSAAAAANSGLVLEAVSRAQSHLDAVASGGLLPGEREGDDGGGFRWHVRVVPVASAAPPRFFRTLAKGGGATLFAVAVEISWPGPAGGVRSFTLNTRRLGSAPDTGP